MSDSDADLPLDSDVEVDTAADRRPKPVHLSWANIGLVAAGGAFGTGLRYLTALLVPVWAKVPMGTFAVNIVGAFLLGALLELLIDRRIGANRSRRLRLALGTGALGGFTTYSALAVDTATLALTHPGRAAAYALVTVTLGAAASAVGIGLSRRYLRPTSTDRSNR